ncbi:MAG: DUF4336 domain-containing protein [Ahrensia sp.]|nr:DUF4336 domain-containing protein [Ahrensia sp.]
MVGSYDPYQPLNTLIGIGPDIWIVNGPVLQWGYGIPIKWPFPTRMTIVRLPDGGLWLHSPTSPDEALIGQIEALGPVRHLVSPNLIHHVSIGAWAKRFPDARVWASPGVRDRSEVHFTDDLADMPPEDWASAIDQRIARGSSILEEAIFFHKASKVLILTDLIENFEDERLHGWLARIMYRLIGVMAPNGRAPRDLRATFSGHHDQLKPVVDWMIGCAPEKVVIAHGKWFEEDGTAVIRRAFSWVSAVD